MPEVQSPWSEIEARLRGDGQPALAVAAFRLQYERLRAGETGFVPEVALEPVAALPDLEALPEELAEVGRAASGGLVLLKLNGGLGTSMGLVGPKSLLPVKAGRTFLDLIAAQAKHARLPLMLLNSFATQGPSMAALAPHGPLSGALPADLLQHRVPKIDARTLAAVDWPEEPLTWCPPGHGDLYTALVTRGVLPALLAAGKRYLFVSNGDNLGATWDPRLLGHLVREGLPLLMEVCHRTAADRKGGHLARRGGRLVLRESAQCSPADLPAFQDIARHRYFNTNSLWLDLRALAHRLDAAPGGVLPLPLIRNAKSVDPRAPDSPAVYQLETAMGAAIGVFAGAGAVRVPRSRFAPVKTTADLLVVRSDATTLTPDHRVVANPARRAPRAPLVELDPRHYRRVDDFDARFPRGAPSLVGCAALRVEGDVRFGAGVVLTGEISLVGPAEIAAGAHLGPGGPGGAQR